MRTFNWTPQVCGVLREKLKSYVEVVNQYDCYLIKTGVWQAPDRYEKYVKPKLNAVLAYVVSLGFTQEEAEICFPTFYEQISVKSIYERYARNLSEIIWREND